MAQLPIVSAAQAPLSLWETCEYNEFKDGKRVLRALRPRVFFRYTPEKARPFLGNEDYLLCTGFIAEAGKGKHILHLTITIEGVDVATQFGEMPPKSILYVKTIQKKAFLLKTPQGAVPRIFNGKTIYECTYNLQRKDRKKLKKQEIDSIRLFWDEGFQEYSIHYVDFIIDQFNCLEKKSKK